MMAVVIVAAVIIVIVVVVATAAAAPVLLSLPHGLPSIVIEPLPAVMPRLKNAAVVVMD